MDSETIQELLRQHLQDPYVSVSGDGHHFEALVVSPEFEGLKLIAQHRRVKDVLREQLDSGYLHAISLRTLTPAQWQGEAG